MTILTDLSAATDDRLVHDDAAALPAARRKDGRQSEGDGAEARTTPSTTCTSGVMPQDMIPYSVFVVIFSFMNYWKKITIE